MKTIELFKTLSNETRLRIVNLLLQNKLCVCQIEQVLDMKQVNISRQLIVLRESGIVKCFKINQWVYYEINLDEEYVEILHSFIEKVGDTTLADDIKTLNNLTSKQKLVCSDKL